MSRSYFEIVFDDSGSMDTSLAGSTRLNVAKDLFEKEIFPLIDNNTEVAVRLLRNECGGESDYHNFGKNRFECLRFIRGIYATKGTPLFNTMKDALETTLGSSAIEKTIFVLTDGEDNCGLPIDNVLTKAEQQYFKQINVILAQFTVNNSYAVNQLSHLANTIGAKTFNFATSAGASISSIRTELKTALNVIGMNKSEPLRHCFEELLGDLVYWKDIESMGIQLHQARVLYDEHFLSWKPEHTMRVNPLQLAELKFLFGIRFKTGIGVEMMRTMISQLIKPYYYNSNCIYWHFEEARWKYFPQPAPIVVEKIVEKEVPVEVIKEKYRDISDKNSYSECYSKKGYYMVSSELDWNNNRVNKCTDVMDSDHFKLKQCDRDERKVVVIHEGDILKYENKKPKGRPRKSSN